MARCFVVCSMVLLLLAQAGCSSPEEAKTYPVSGEVTLDGKPLSGATIMLQPAGRGSLGFGESDASGLFVISTFELGDGAIPGEHNIVVTYSSTDGDEGADPEKSSIVVPARYSKPESSGLQVTVEEGLGPLTLNLTSVE